MNIIFVNLKIIQIADAMIGKSSLPNLPREFEFFSPERESAFHKLHCPLKSCFGGNDEMEVVPHQDKFVEGVSLFPIVEQHFNEEVSPFFIMK